VFTPQDDNETVVAYRARVPGIPAKMSFTIAGKCREYVNREFNAAISTRRCAMLKNRPEALT